MAKAAAAVILGMVLGLAIPAAADVPDVNSATEYAECVVTHVQEMGGFTGAMNPGVHHEGFSGWEPCHDGG